MVGLPDGEKIEDMFIRFYRIHERDRHTHRHTHTPHDGYGHPCITSRGINYYNKCIGDDTKAAARQSPNCIKRQKKLAKNDFQYGGWNYYTLQCGMWLWNHDSEFTNAMWYMALGWHAMEFAQTSAILEFYIWFRFWPYHCSWHVILHQSAKFYPNPTILGRNKWRHVDFQDGGSQPSWILRIQ